MTTSVTPSIESAQIAEFARSVRDALADLPPEEVDDLTEGLEADLAESLAEDLRRTLPDPVAYAAELRTAAGLPARAPQAGRGPLAGLTDGWNDLCDAFRVVVRRNPSLVSTIGFLDSLRPIWWVTRAWLAAWLVAALFGGERGYVMDRGWWIVLVAFAVISVQWGRGQWLARGVRALIVVGNVFAVVVLLPVLAVADDWGGGGSYSAGYEDAMSQGHTSTEGLAFNGQPLENIYAYDAAGKPLRGVQLFDVDGHPLVTSRNTEDSPLVPQPATLETGARAYNVFPLDLVWMTYDDYDELVVNPSPDPDKAKAFRDGPFIKVPAVE